MTETPLVQLVSLDLNDKTQVEWMYAVRAHPEVVPHFFAPPPSSYVHHIEFLRKAQESQERQFWIILFDNQMTGYCQLIHRLDSLEVGLALHPAWWGRGIGQAAMQALLDYAQSLNTAKEIALVVKKDNARAMHIYEKLGFVHLQGVSYQKLDNRIQNAGYSPPQQGS